jgi:hypothetical protein
LCQELKFCHKFLAVVFYTLREPFLNETATDSPRRALASADGQIHASVSWRTSFYKNKNNPKNIDTMFAIKDTTNALENFNCKN